MKKLVFSIYLLSFLLFFSAELSSQNVIIVVIDGARYSETFGSENKYIPRMWDIMKPKGTIYTNFYNDGVTKTNPGHAAILTGTWQDIPNDGSKRPTKPTIFEYFRKQLGIAQSENCVVAGADKLSAMSYSTHLLYGSSYAAMDITNDYTGDLATYENLISLMDDLHPRLVFVNFKEVDTKAHDGSWEEYLAALRQVDSLIHKLWEKIQAQEVRGEKDMVTSYKLGIGTSYSCLGCGPANTVLGEINLNNQQEGIGEYDENFKDDPTSLSGMSSQHSLIKLCF